jgi:hypothetical protein
MPKHLVFAFLVSANGETQGPSPASLRSLAQDDIRFHFSIAS